LINAGAFKDVDICIMAHPGPENIVYGSWLALQTLKIEYFGKSSHASAAPWDGNLKSNLLGINALDAAVSAYSNLSHLRQQILPTDRIHGIISHGGDAPNIIPSYCKMEYYIRSKTLSQLKKLQPRVTSCFKAAALSSGCTVEVSPGSTMGDVVGNSVLGQLYEAEMIGLGVKMSKDPDHKPRGSTDMGNVTHHLPGLHPLFSLSYDGELDFSYHTADFAKHTRSNEAMKCAIRCSKALAFTGISCVLDPDLMKKAKLEFVTQVSDK
jgi:metal-dependent amidase/aminoacylase/carboxypeptidase family protein